jgi:hypothetical protein
MEKTAKAVPLHPNASIVDSWGRHLYCHSCGKPLPKSKAKPRIVCGNRQCGLAHRRWTWLYQGRRKEKRRC